MANHSSYSVYSASRRGRSPLKMFSLFLTALLIVGVGIVAALDAAGVIRLPFLHGEASHIGQVLVPMSGQPIAAFTKVTREHLADPRTRDYSVKWMDKALVESHKIIANPQQIVGRVLDHDKPPGYAFTEEDFLPKGTRPGIVAGIPPGKRSMTLEASKIQGVHALKAGDRFDLLATSQIEPAKNGGLPADATHIGSSAIASTQKQAKVQVLVQNGMVVTPASLRAEPTTSSSLMGGTKTTTRPVQEIVIAVDPQELAPLSEALALSASITCVARSGHPDDPDTASVPPSIPLDDKPHVIETISGTKRKHVIVPAAIRPRSSPVVPVSGTSHHDHGTRG